MFSLIITLVSIALVAALALATLYFGSTAHTQAQAKAQGLAVVNESKQLSAAVTLYKVREGADVTDFSQLIDKQYLTTAPGGTWTVTSTGVERRDLSENQCLAANRQLGIDAVPACDDPAFEGKEVCCVE